MAEESETKTLAEEDRRHFVRLRGLPYSAKEADVRIFLEGIETRDITFTQAPDGRPSGECYVELKCAEAVNRTLEKDRSNLGSRYIEVFAVGEVELDQILRRTKIKEMTSNKGFIRIHGLPFNCKREEVAEFFIGLTVEDVVFGKEPGPEGRPTGDGFVQFSAAEEADKALEFNGKHLGSRYLEIFKIDGSAFNVFKQMASPKIMPLKNIVLDPPEYWNYQRYMPYQDYGYVGYNGAYKAYDPRRYDRRAKGGGKFSGGKGGGRGRGNDRHRPYNDDFYDDQFNNLGYYPPSQNDIHVSPLKIFVRGLPFHVNLEEIEAFFAPLQCINVWLGSIRKTWSSGDGIVEFKDINDAKRALLKDQQNIGNRYVELFPTTRINISPTTIYELAMPTIKREYCSGSNGSGDVLGHSISFSSTVTNSSIHPYSSATSGATHANYDSSSPHLNSSSGYSWANNSSTTYNNYNTYGYSAYQQTPSNSGYAGYGSLTAQSQLVSGVNDYVRTTDYSNFQSNEAVYGTVPQKAEDYYKSYYQQAYPSATVSASSLSGGYHSSQNGYAS